MSLESAFVEPSTTSRFSAILYGPEGSRKSTAAVSAPDPNLYLNADRRDGIRFGRTIHPDRDVREVRVTGLETLHETIFYVREHPELETVTLDTVGRIFDLVLRSMAKDDKRATLPEIGQAQTEVERFIETLIEEDVNVVLVAHDLTVKTTGSEHDGTLTFEQMPMTGTSKPGFSQKLMRLVSIVAYCGVMDGNGVAQVFEAGGRRAKDGTGALVNGDDAVPLDLSVWADRIAQFYAASVAAGNDEPEKEGEK